MKTLKKISAVCLILASTVFSQAQIISNLNNLGAVNNFVEPCGSHHLMQKFEHANEGFMNLSDNLLNELNDLISQGNYQKSYQERFVIPVVFHVVYNNPDENIPESVLLNQLAILNACFRRQNPDASSVRPEFQSLVGDAEIEFELATIDPNGLPTSGITRTATSVEYFGGTLPYGPGQNAQITQWVEDSLYYNMFRLTQNNLGGHDSWDTDNYLNIWIGDLRIFEPQFNNFKELVYMGLATPPQNHVNWPPLILQELSAFEQGVLMHYVNIGDNNPVGFPAPYTTYNGVVNTGKMLVHEVGHYLGLRHIWGDGDCSADDFISDTPNSISSSSYDCNLTINSCVDNINGADLHDMVENYMDYSSGNCQNSFTIGQADLMRAVLETYRQDLPEVVSVVSTESLTNLYDLSVSPNPSSGIFSIDLSSSQEHLQVHVINGLGEVVYLNQFESVQSVQIKLSQPPGIYFVKIQANGGTIKTMKIVIL